MKKLHTLLGASPRKKLVLGAAALTLMGSVSPLGLNNVYADHIVAPYEPTPQIPISIVDPMSLETAYTLVGPDYFTSFAIGSVPSGITFQITDTSVADFFTDDEKCSTRFACLQGKKIGETEIIIKEDGEEVKRTPLISAEMTPKSVVTNTMGGVINETGSLNGADNDALSLIGVRKVMYNLNEDDDGITVEQTGPRSFSIDTTNRSAAFSYIRALWSIGDQLVAGGTDYVFQDVIAEDRINGSKETEDILIDAWLSIVAATRNSTKPDYGSTVDIIGRDGSIFRLPVEPLVLNGLKNYRVILDRNEASVTKIEEQKHLEKMPENVKDVSFDNISVKAYACYDSLTPIIDEDEGGYNIYNVNTPLAAGSTDDEEYVEDGEFIKLGTAINVTLDASDAPAVAEGYTRKYYVTITKNDGSIEVVDAEYNAEDKNFTFAISEFGNIAYGYVDKEIKAEPAGESVVPKVPNTGIAPAKIMATAAATILPLLGISAIAFMIRNKKKASNKLAKKHNHFE